MNIREFWEKTYKINAPMMLGVCRRYVPEIPIAEDLMQEAFATAIRKFDTYNGKGPLEAWLRRIAVNTSLMYLRAESVRKVRNHLWTELTNEDDQGEPDEEGRQAVVAGADFTEEELLAMIDQLPQHHKMVFNMYVLDHFSHEEIAKELNIATGTSKSHLARARRKLQELLYAKAVEKGGKRKRNPVMAAIFGFFSTDDANMIFKKGLKRFNPTPEISADRLFDSVDWSVSSSVHGKLGVTSGLMKNFKIYLWTAATATLLLVVPVYRSITSYEPLKPDPVHSRQTIPSAAVDTMPVSQPDTSDAVRQEPVIVHKTLIRHVPVIIRDTIKIADTTNEN